MMKSIKSVAGMIILALCSWLPAMACADNVTFSYQGHIKVQGQPFNGSGLFKFSILNTSGTATLWSNDGTASGEPVASVSLQVVDGVFSALIGDNSLGMSPISASVFASQTPLKLRVWFNGNGLGFEQLNPDQKLVDLTLNTVSTGTQDYTIYVNGTSGNDAFSGLTPATAKKTIQAAVDIVPPQLRCNVTIRISAGDYKETVRIYGVTSSGTVFTDSSGNMAYDGTCLKIVGDESWTTASAGNPTVRIMGADSDVPASAKVRRYGVSAHNCSAIEFHGLWFDKASSAGAKVETGSYIFRNCQGTNNGFTAVQAMQGSFVGLYGCEASANANGFYVWEGILYIAGCYSHNNTAGGFAIQGPGFARVFSTTISNDNDWAGFACGDTGVLQLEGSSFTATGNGRFGVEVNTEGVAHGTSSQNLVGNDLGAVGTVPGGHLYN